MSSSKIEEIIGVLWIIAAILAFSSEHPTWGWILATKGGADIVCSIIFAVQEIRGKA